jgi:hypothetical protein
MGTASWSCVRPIFTSGWNSCPLARKASASLAHRGAQPVDALVQGELERRGVDVVGALAEVDVRVGRERGVVAAVAAEQLEGAVGDDLVGVHVARRPRPALDHVDEEVLVVAPLAHLGGGALDHLGGLGRQQPELGVGPRGRGLDRGERDDQRRELAQRHAGDREVLEGAQRLHAVERVGRHVALAEQVALLARAAAGEARGAAVADERGVGGAEPRGDAARGAGDERGVGGRRLLDEVVHRGARERGHRHRRQGAGRGAVGVGVAEQQPLADRLAGAERRQAHRAPLGRLLDRDAPGEHDEEEPARRALLEERRALVVVLDRHGARQAPDVGVGEPGEEGGGAQAVGERGGGGGCGGGGHGAQT